MGLRKKLWALLRIARSSKVTKAIGHSGVPVQEKSKEEKKLSGKQVKKSEKESTVETGGSFIESKSSSGSPTSTVTEGLEKQSLAGNMEKDANSSSPKKLVTIAEVDPKGESDTEISDVTSPRSPMHVNFPPGTTDPRESLDRRRRRRACRVRASRSGINVKYTKVYGESDGAYKNDSTPRGLVFMCNFAEFDNKRYGERKGSEIDYHNMLELFQQLGYTAKRDEAYCRTGHITRRDFMENLKAFSQDTKHRILCSCVIIIMSHGSGPKSFVTSDDKQVDLMEVYSMFNNINCDILRGKPKIFILQFCRNSAITPSPLSASYISNIRVDLPPNETIDETRLRQMVQEEVRKFFAEYVREDNTPNILNGRQILEPHGVPDSSEGRQLHSDGYETDSHSIYAQPGQEGLQKYSDMYSIFSTASGELSHRDPRKGSLLIQAICHVFAEYAYQDDIDTLVRKVSTYMSKTLQKDDPITVPRVTCERTNNGLDKKFYFNPVELHHCRHVTI